jgi:hypothetical protein
MSDGQASSADPGGRNVVVPLRLYKTIIVFSTLIAVVAVVGGFLLLDAATLQTSFLRSLLESLLAALGLGVADGILSGILAVVALLVIAGGAGVYVLGTRFQAEGMGNSQEDADEHSDNG